MNENTNRQGRRSTRRSSILKTSRPLGSLDNFGLDDRPYEKRRVSFNHNIMVKEFLDQGNQAIDKKEENDNKLPIPDIQPDLSNVYLAPANESFYQISTPVGAKKRRITSSFLPENRLSLIPPLDKSLLGGDLEFEPFAEESPAMSIAEKQTITLPEKDILLEQNDMMRATVMEDVDMSLTLEESFIAPHLLQGSPFKDYLIQDIECHTNQPITTGVVAVNETSNELSEKSRLDPTSFPMSLLTPPKPCSEPAPPSADIPETETHVVVSNKEHTVYGGDLSMTCVADITDMSLCTPAVSPEIHNKSVMMPHYETVYGGDMSMTLDDTQTPSVCSKMTSEELNITSGQELQTSATVLPVQVPITTDSVGTADNGGGTESSDPVLSSDTSTVQSDPIILNTLSTNIPLISSAPETNINNLSVVILNAPENNNPVISIDPITPSINTLSVSHSQAKPVESGPPVGSSEWKIRDPPSLTAGHKRPIISQSAVVSKKLAITPSSQNRFTPRMITSGIPRMKSPFLSYSGQKSHTTQISQILANSLKKRKERNQIETITKSDTSVRAPCQSDHTFTVLPTTELEDDNTCVDKTFLIPDIPVEVDPDSFLQKPNIISNDLSDDISPPPHDTTKILDEGQCDWLTDQRSMDSLALINDSVLIQPEVFLATPSTNRSLIHTPTNQTRPSHNLSHSLVNSTQRPSITIPVSTTPAKAKLRHLASVVPTLQQSPRAGGVVDSPLIQTPEMAILDGTLNQTQVPSILLEDDSEPELEPVSLSSRKSLDKSILQRFVQATNANKSLHLEVEYEAQQKRRQKEEQEQQKRQQLLEEQKKQEQKLLEEQRQQQLIEEQKKQEQLEQQKLIEEQRQQQLIEEQKKQEQLEQQKLIEEQRQQQLIEEQKKQEQLEQQKLIEEQRQQQLIEKQKKQEQLEQQKLIEEQRQQQLIEEQKKQEQLEQQKLIEEQNQQQLIEEQKKQEQLEQQKIQQLPVDEEKVLEEQTLLEQQQQQDLRDEIEQPQLEQLHEVVHTSGHFLNSPDTSILGSPVLTISSNINNSPVPASLNTTTTIQAKENTSTTFFLNVTQPALQNESKSQTQHQLSTSFHSPEFSLSTNDDDNSPLIEIDKQVHVDAVHLDDNHEGLPLIDTLEIIHSRFKELHDATNIRLTSHYTTNERLLWCLKSFHSKINACVCVVRCMIDYARLTEVGNTPFDFSFINWDSIPNLDNDSADRKGTLLQKALWSRQLATVLFTIYPVLLNVCESLKQVFNWCVYSWAHDAVAIQVNDQFRIIIDLDTGGTSNSTLGVVCQKLKNIEFEVLKDDISVHQLKSLPMKYRSVLELPVMIQSVLQCV